MLSLKHQDGELSKSEMEDGELSQSEIEEGEIVFENEIISYREVDVGGEDNFDELYDEYQYDDSIMPKNDSVLRKRFNQSFGNQNSLFDQVVINEVYEMIDNVDDEYRNEIQRYQNIINELELKIQSLEVIFNFKLLIIKNSS